MATINNYEGFLPNAEDIEVMANSLAVIAAAKAGTAETTPAALHSIARAGIGPRVFAPGDQMVVKWNDNGTAGTEYDADVDFAHFKNVELEGGELTPGIVQKFHYTLSFGTEFDAPEAFYAVPAAGLPAGKYYIEFPQVSDKIAAGIYEFTTTVALSEGAQLCINDNASPTVTTYATCGAREATETLATTKVTSSTGTSLGQVAHNVVTETNNCWTRVIYGYNRWSQSAIRQYLNSDAADWWEPQNPFDRPPTYVARAGFLAGLPAELVAVMGKVKTQTLCNSVTDGSVVDTTYDKVFLPSFAEAFVNDSAAAKAVEGEPWDWFVFQADNAGVPLTINVTYPQTRAFQINAKTAQQGVWSRSPSRGYAYYVYGRLAAGTPHVTHASNSPVRARPAWVIV